MSQRVAYSQPLPSSPEYEDTTERALTRSIGHARSVDGLLHVWRASQNRMKPLHHCALLSALARSIAPQRSSSPERHRELARLAAGEILADFGGCLDVATPRMVANALLAASRTGVALLPLAPALLAPLYCYVADNAAEFDIMHSSQVTLATQALVPQLQAQGAMGELAKEEPRYKAARRGVEQTYQVINALHPDLAQHHGQADEHAATLIIENGGSGDATVGSSSARRLAVSEVEQMAGHVSTALTRLMTASADELDKHLSQKKPIQDSLHLQQQCQHLDEAGIQAAAGRCKSDQSGAQAHIATVIRASAVQPGNSSDSNRESFTSSLDPYGDVDEIEPSTPVPLIALASSDGWQGIARGLGEATISMGGAPGGQQWDRTNAAGDGLEVAATYEDEPRAGSPPSHMQPRHVVTLFKGMAQLGFLAYPLQHNCSRYLSRYSSRLNPQDVSNALWTFAVYGAVDVFAFRRLVGQAVALQVELDLRHIAIILWSLATLQHFNDKLFFELSRQVVGMALKVDGAASPPPQPQADAAALTYSSAGQDGVLLATQGSKQQTLAAVVTARRTGASGRLVAGDQPTRAAGVGGKRVTTGGVGTIGRESELRMSDIRSISLVVWALGQGNYLYPDLLDVLAHHLTRPGFLRLATSHDLCALLQGYAAVNYYVPALWAAATKQLAEKGVTASATPRERAQLALLCSMFGNTARQASLRRVVTEAVADVDWKANAKGAVQLLQAELLTRHYTGLAAQHHAGWTGRSGRSPCEETTDSGRSNIESQGQVSVVRGADGESLTAEAAQTGGCLLLGEKQIRALTTAVRQYQQRVQSLDFKQGRVLRLIRGNIHMLPFHVENVVSEYVDDKVIGPIDIALFVLGGYRIAVQVNGPQHYCRVLPPQPFQPPLQGAEGPSWTRYTRRQKDSRAHANWHHIQAALLGSDIQLPVHQRRLLGAMRGKSLESATRMVLERQDTSELLKNDPFGERNTNRAVRQSVLPPSGQTYVGTQVLQASGWVVVGLPVEVLDQFKVQADLTKFVMGAIRGAFDLALVQASK